MEKEAQNTREAPVVDEESEGQKDLGHSGFVPKSQDPEIQQEMKGVFSKKYNRVVLERDEDVKLLESKGFGIREGEQFYLKDYEALYLMYTGKLKVRKGGHDFDFPDFVNLTQTRDESSWTRFLVFRDLRSRGYVVREGFGFPIDFRVYDRGDYGQKAAKYIVFGMIEGRTVSAGELKKHIEEMSTMGKEAVVAVVERRGEVIYYKVAKWRPIKPS